MRKSILLFLIMSLLGFVYFAIDSGYFNFKKKIPGKGFVVINDIGFQLNGEDFYPIVLNYMVSVQTDGDSIWPSSFKGYGENSNFNFTNRDSNLVELSNEMQLIKEMGFNAVRIVAISEYFIDNKLTGLLSFRAHIGNERDSIIGLYDQITYDKYFGAIKDLLTVINNAGLKVILLTPVFDEVDGTKVHLKKLMTQFKNDTTIFAWDLFNEPLYFDSLARDKKEPYYITKKWKRLVEKYAPNHLCTIGLTGVREVFEWDPNLLDFDFLSFHPYEYEPEQVRNEMYWYSKYVDTPWIIGETSLPADNDSVPYLVQQKFAELTMNQALNCGAKGYSWWQYKDVEWFEFHSNFMGVVAHAGTSQTASGNFVSGSVKPISESIKSFNPSKNKDTCMCLDNYYNYSKGTECRIKGVLVDEDDIPIEGGVILGWNEHWSSSYHTISKKDGTFELMGTFPFYHWMASATRHTMVRGDVNPETSKYYSDKIATMDIGKLKLTKMSQELKR